MRIASFPLALIISASLWASLCTVATCQSLDPADTSKARAYLHKTYSDNCKDVKNEAEEGTQCVFRYNNGAHYVAVFAGRAAVYPKPKIADVISIETSEEIDPQVEKQFFYLAHQTTDKGMLLSEKYPTINDLKEYCLKRPDAQNKDGKLSCLLDETMEPGVTSGLWIEWATLMPFQLIVQANKRTP